MVSAPRFVIMSGLARRLARQWGSSYSLPAALRAARGARRIGTVRIGVLGLQLPVYRVVLLDRPVELITRRIRGGATRVLAVLPAAVPGDDYELGENVQLPESELNELALELLAARSDTALENFFGGLVKAVGRAASGLVKGVSKTVSAVGKGIGRAIDIVNRFVPIKSLIGMPFATMIRFAGSLGRVLKGENIFKVAEQFLKAGMKDLGQAVQLASTVASFVPGVGTGVAAALGAAGALASGKPITEAVMSAARAAIPGGPIAQAAFDTAANLVKGQNLGEAVLSAARNRIPGGPAAQAAFDAGLALARGKSLQGAAMAAAGRLMPPSPFASNALVFVNKLASGQSLQNAALSTAGQAALSRLRGQRELELAVA
jgi:hypothetical protein